MLSLTFNPTQFEDKHVVARPHEEDYEDDKPGFQAALDIWQANEEAQQT